MSPASSATTSAPLPSDSSDLIGAAQALVPRIRAAREEGERLRHVAPDIAAALSAAHLLHMYLPRALGGPQAHPLVAYRAVEILSRADGSVGWCAMIASAQSAYTGWLGMEAGRHVAGTPANVSLAGSIRPLGRARVVEGGWRVSGQWDFASGVHHATWMICTCIVVDGDKPRRDAAGAPVLRVMWVPRGQIRLLDTWHVVGLRGTGSHDFAVDDVFVPTAHATWATDPPQHLGPNYDARLNTTWAWTPTLANALGIARGAMDAFADMATRTTTMSTAALRDRAPTQARTGEAEAIIESARAYAFAAIGELWDLASAGVTGPALDAPLTRARLAITHGIHEARRAVDLLFHAAGTNAVYARSHLERCFRDIHVAVQHGAALPVHYESAGKSLLGLRPTDPGW